MLCYFHCGTNWRNLQKPNKVFQRLGCYSHCSKFNSFPYAVNLLNLFLIFVIIRAIIPIIHIYFACYSLSIFHLMANDSPLNKIRKNVSFHGGIPGSPDEFCLGTGVFIPHDLFAPVTWSKRRIRHRHCITLRSWPCLNF